MDERLRAIRELRTQEKAEFHGEFVDFAPAYSWPKPVQRPHPPIYVGGGEGAFPRVAALGDAWLANGVPPGQLGPQIARMRNTAGRDVPVTVYGVPADPAVIEEYARLDVERLLFSLPTVPEAETLTHLDRFAEVAGRFR
ncbi:LLM class flavin-dependent oxidoreductase [Streptomyces noursei]|uniref:LLM class flavin-dependent oxidoreductase n=1 Tax=Streptomyces noursei TaxID=1971 RepID=UPI003645A723